MPRLIPSLTATSTLLLTLLATPLLAQQTAPDATSGEQPDPTTEELQRPPLAERSEVEAQALEQRLQTKEQQQLQAADERFLALWLPANVGTPSGVVILLPGDDGNPDSAQSVGPLRRKLPNAGWHSLSLSLPDPNSDMPAPRSTELVAEPAPVSVDTAQEEVQEEVQDSAPTSAEEPVPAPATDAPPTAQEQQKAHAERVLARIESAIAFAAEQQARSIVLLGHGSGAYWAARYLAERQPAEVRNLLVVAASVPAGYTPALDELIPQLQLATGDFYYKDQLLDRQAATRRMQASKRQKHPTYIQIAMKALPGNLEAEHEQLYRRIRGWLTLKIQAK
jgi:pimeloyl-ACP methyl ester carboxylesterase